MTAVTLTVLRGATIAAVGFFHVFDVEEGVDCLRVFPLVVNDEVRPGETQDACRKRVGF